MALREGFIVPNSGTYAPDYQTAQPDQGDYLILGNSRYGVIQGCAVTLQSSTVVIGAAPNLVFIDGQVVSVPAGSTSLNIANAGTDPRFDLVCVSQTEGLTLRVGAAQANPVFPDVPAGDVVLAAVYTNTSGVRRVIDKRVFLQPSIVSVQNAVTPYHIVKHHSSDGQGVKFSIDGNGKISWGSGASASADTHLERLESGELKISDGLTVTDLTVSGTASIAGYSVVTDNYIKWDTSANRPTSADVGDVFVDTTTGTLNVWRTDPSDNVAKWFTVQPNVPAGAVVMSFLSPDKMEGYLPLDGSTVTKAAAGNLWSLHPEWRLANGTEFLQLPNMAGRFPLGRAEYTTANTATGTVRDAAGTIGISLKTDNLPAHRHFPQGPAWVTDSVGGHEHPAQIATSSGAHSHTVAEAGNHSHSYTDPTHDHFWGGGWPIVAVDPDAPHDSCMDNPFVDSSHNYRTRPELLSTPATVNIQINEGGRHSHTLSGSGTHSHTATVGAGGGHFHTLPTESAVGNNQEITFAPPSLSLYFYIKT